MIVWFPWLYDRLVSLVVLLFGLLGCIIVWSPWFGFLGCIIIWSSWFGLLGCMIVWFPWLYDRLVSLVVLLFGLLGCMIRLVSFGIIVYSLVWFPQL